MFDFLHIRTPLQRIITIRLNNSIYSIYVDYELELY
jgi:hypothetical protein